MADDGKIRCFGSGNELHAKYHDEEWGRPLKDTKNEHWLFERLALEGFLAGLSWLTILRKRDAFRRAFHNFDPAKVAKFGEPEIEELMANPEIIRNRRKIEAAVGNAQALLDLHKQGGRLVDLLHEHLPAEHVRPKDWADIPASTPESTALSKHLKKLGFRFVGPVTLYSTWQAIGMIDDHLATCWLVTEGHLPA